MTKRSTAPCQIAGNKFYPATLLTDAPLLVLQSAIAAVTSGGAASLPLQPLLCLRGFSYSTPGGWLCVKGLSLEVPPRGSVLLEGPSGCGKSTLMRCLAGLHPWQGDSCVLPPPGQVCNSRVKGCSPAEYCWVVGVIA